MLAGLIVKRAQLHAQIVALLHKGDMLFQFAQTFCGLFAETLPQLVALEQQPGVGGIGNERQTIHRLRLGWPMADVEIANGKIAPDDGEIWIKQGAPLP